MKKSKKFIVGIVLAVAGALGFIGSRGNGAVMFGSGILIVVGILLIYYGKKSISKSIDIQGLNRSDNVQASNLRFTKYEFKLVGVTFRNNKGKSRQALLRKLNFHDEPFVGKVNFSLEKYKYNNEVAVRILANGEDIGNVPRDNLNYIIDNYDNIFDVQVLVVGGGENIDGEKINYGGKVLLGVKQN